MYTTYDGFYLYLGYIHTMYVLVKNNNEGNILVTRARRARRIRVGGLNLRRAAAATMADAWD